MHWPAKLIGPVMLLALFLFSCEEPGEIDLGLNPADNIRLENRVFSVEASQVWLDSIPTSRQGTLLFGKFRDDIFGEIKASTFAQLGILPSGNPTIPTDAIFDSLELKLAVTSYHGNLFSGQQVFSVFRLTEGFSPIAEYFPNSSLAFNPVPLGQKTMRVQPGLDSLISIRISDELGRDFFQKIIAGAPEIMSSAAFQNYFNGIAIVPGDQNNGIYGVGVNSILSGMVLHFRAGSDTLSYRFGFQGQAHFNRLQQDRSGSILAGITSPQVDFEPGTGEYYTHAGIGMLTKLKFSELEEFFKDVGVFKLNLAELEIRINNPAEHLQPPASILFYYTDSNNDLQLRGGEVGAIQTDGSDQLNTFNNLRLDYNSIQRTYKGSITGYLQGVFDGRVPYDQVFIIPSQIGANLRRMEVPIEDIKINIFYTVVVNP